MKARAVSTALMCIVLCFSTTAGAQDGGAPDASAPDAPAEEPPTAGSLPLEDPTIEPPRDEDLQIDQSEEAAAEVAATESSAGPETDRGDGSKARAAGPIEDPTLHHAEDSAPEGETPPAAEGPEPQEEPAPADKDPNVKVSYDRGFLLGIDDWFFLALSGLVQARYTVNYRTKPPTDPITGVRDKQVTQGFAVSRARFTLGIGLTEFVAMVMRIGVVAGGEFDFQRAFIDLKWKFLRLRAGLFMNELIAESLINPNDLFFLDYSIVENVYTPGSSKGVMLTYLRRRFSINLGYSDGLRTGFSEIRSAATADFAVTLRTQYAWGDAGLGGFNRLMARRGTPFGVRLGGAVHYQTGGRTQGSVAAKIAMGTIDLSIRGSGWSALVSATVGQDATDATATNEAAEVLSAGVTAMGGYFVLDDLQVFAQYSVLPKLKVVGALPPPLPGEPPPADPSYFHAFGVGMAFFVLPEHDNVKLQSDFQYFLGSERGSTVPASPLNSIQPNYDGSQFSWRIQLTAAF
jgi:hypothetical protein